MKKSLIKAIDNYIGEPLPELLFLFFPAMLFAPLMFLIWATDMMERACPIELEAMLKVAVGEEKVLLRELMAQKEGKVRKFHLWKLRGHLQSMPWKAAQKRIDSMFSPTKGQK